MSDPKDSSARSEHIRDVLEHIHTLDTTRYVFVFTKKNLRDGRRTCFSLFSTTLYITK